MLGILGASLMILAGFWFFGDRFKKVETSPGDKLRAEYIARKKVDAPELIVGQPQRSAALPENDSSNFYALRLDAGDYIRLTIDALPKPYRSAAVVMILLDPRDEVVALTDESAGVQHVSALAETSGLYHVRVHRYNGVKSPHCITLIERRRGGEQDRIRAAAYRALTTAYQIQDGNLDSKELAKEALLKYEEALELVRSINDRREEAFVLSQMSEVYYWTDDHSRCDDYRRQSLTVYRAVGDREGERALVDRLRWNNPDRQLALEYNRRFAEMAGEDGDFLSEVSAFKQIAKVYENAQTSEDTARALETYKSALAVQNALSARLATESNVSPDTQFVFYSKRDEAEILLKIGEMQNRLGQTADALESCGQALKLARECKSRLGERELTSKLVESDALKMIDEIKSAKTKQRRR